MNRSPALAALLAFALLGCSDDSPGTLPHPSGLTLEKLSVDGTSVVAGAAVSPAVRVVRGGRPVAGEEVRFSMRGGDGMLIDSVTTTNAEGRAEALWLLGLDPGRQVVSARAGDGSTEFSVTATAPAAGTSYLGRNGYVEYIAGDLPIIISSPHGGALRPAEIPDRSSAARDADINTDDVARRIAAALTSLTGRRPHLVLQQLHRSKLDANREIREAAAGDPHAERAWHEYHRWIETAERAISRGGGRGFYLDVHAHGHPVARIELGYLLTSSALSRPDAELNAPSFVRKSSIRSLAERSPTPFATLLRGDQSLGELLVRRGYPAVPSLSDPSPGNSPYFDGGYSTERHSSLNGGPVDGVQAEINYQIMISSPEQRDVFARAFAESLLDYLERYAGLRLRKGA